MGVLRSLNTILEAHVSQTGHGRRNSDGCERRTVPEAVISQSCHRRRDGDGRERRTTVEAKSCQTCHTICYAIVGNTIGNDNICSGATIFCEFGSLCRCVQIERKITFFVINPFGTHPHT